jgi:hypothetical protein
MIIQTILLDPSGSVWIDAALNVSRLFPSCSVQSDAEHLARNRKVVGWIPPRAPNRRSHSMLALPATQRATGGHSFGFEHHAAGATGLASLRRSAAHLLAGADLDAGRRNPGETRRPGPAGRWIVGGTIYAATLLFPHFNERESPTRLYRLALDFRGGSLLLQGAVTAAPRPREGPVKSRYTPHVRVCQGAEESQAVADGQLR